jgi:YD repeat-containing protein
LYDIIYLLNKTITYSNDFRGNLVSRQTAKGETVYAYDVLGRLVSITAPTNGGSVSLDYDILGNVLTSSTSITTPSAGTVGWTYQYDALNRATSSICSLSLNGFTSIGYQITHQFDAVGNLTNRLLSGTSGFANQLRTEYKYDVMNRLTNLSATVDAGLQATAAYHYDSAGRLDRKTYGNGDQATNSFDIESRLHELKVLNGANQLKKFHYERDAMGNIKTLESGYGQYQDPRDRQSSSLRSRVSP